jgi:hypothetical protein
MPEMKEAYGPNMLVFFNHQYCNLTFADFDKNVCASLPGDPALKKSVYFE